MQEETVEGEKLRFRSDPKDSDPPTKRKALQIVPKWPPHLYVPTYLLGQASSALVSEKAFPHIKQNFPHAQGLPVAKFLRPDRPAMSERS